MPHDTTPTGARQLLAVRYAFAVWEGGERRLTDERSISASTLAMFLPQLDAVARRTRVDQGPGLLVFDNYRDARQAAQTVATVAAQVTIAAVVPSTVPVGAGWTGAGGVGYAAVPGGLAQTVKE